MTSMEKKTPDADAPASAAEQAGPASGRSADFGIDTTAKSTGEAIRAYATKLRGGDLGALPALLGLLALFILFTALASETFPSLLNLANLLQQGAGQTIIAMGLVFVLLTGEIDLAAGTASGLTAAMMALHLVSNGNLLGAMGTTVFVLVAIGLAVTVVLGVLLRIWSGTVLAARRPAPAGDRLPAEPVAGDAARGLHGRGHRDLHRLPRVPGRDAVVRGHPRAVHRVAGRDPAAHRRGRHAGPARPGDQRRGQRQPLDRWAAGSCSWWPRAATRRCCSTGSSPDVGSASSPSPRGSC